MGLLDDAIREHLELKRLRGADPGAVAREEQDALGPVRREGIGATGQDDEAKSRQDIDESFSSEPSQLRRLGKSRPGDGRAQYGLRAQRGIDSAGVTSQAAHEVRVQRPWPHQRTRGGYRGVARMGDAGRSSR